MLSLEPTKGDAYEPAATFYLRMMVLGQQAVTEARASLLLMGLHREATAKVDLSPLDPLAREEWLGGSFHGRKFDLRNELERQAQSLIEIDIGRDMAEQLSPNAKD
jgi:hypothetical protein